MKSIWQRFTDETPLGRAFLEFENALNEAWRLDTEESFRQHPNKERVAAAWAKEQETRRALLLLLYEAAGIKEEDR